MVAVLIGIVVVVAIVALGVGVVGARAVRTQRRALVEARRAGLAYVCLLPMGQWGGGMRLLVADGETVGVLRPGKERNTWLTGIAAAGARVEKAPVRVNVARTVDGVRCTALDGKTIEVALYPDPTMARTTPLRGLELDTAIQKLQAAAHQ